MKIQGKSVLIFIIFFICEVNAQQISISTIDQMPNHPNPYLMRDWKAVAQGYDSLAFNSQLSGQYLPLISFYNNTINYPEHGSFILHTVVGTTSPTSAEAINLLPAVIGASLVGINKSSQNGRNYALMCEEFFNKRPAENIYLNHPVSSSGDDWWYETMPNVFFYQLNDLYPGTGNFENQFITIADRWLDAVKSMGGKNTPWSTPYMRYRAWNFSTMTPQTQGVIEPEAAGAIAWILYNAYNKTGLEKYRLGAEWCMEYLSGLSANPSYEIQMPYGAFTAARMNAEIGTNYDIQKLVNWCFTNYTYRNWGTIVGTWGGYDVSGLIGETYDNNDNDYAFLMNTLEQAGAVVPLVRYDDRFARTIGKWMLNAANAARFFYTNYLPDLNQDSEEWAHIYDPNSYMGHESMKQFMSTRTPYATGDAISGGWGYTNLALYGSSHVGIFGGIIEKTNVDQILKLDLGKTDYYNNPSYPSYLIFNPYSEVKSVEINIGTGQFDIYEMVSNTFLKRNVSGTVTIDVPADAAVIAVLTPAGGTVTYDVNKMLVNGVTADYRSGQSFNYPPRIKSLAAVKSEITIKDTIMIYCTAEDIDGGTLSYSWSSSGGNLAGSGANVSFYSSQTGTYSIICDVNDGNGGSAADTTEVIVSERINNKPYINYLKALPRKIDIDSSAVVICSAGDADGDQLTFSWHSAAGEFFGTDSAVIWKAPSLPGNYYLSCTVSDGIAQTDDSILVAVRDFSQNQSGSLVLYLPFNGNASDESGNNNTVTVYQASLVPDRFLSPNSAFFFDGSDDYIKVANTSVLNFQNSITINFWMIISSFFDREAYPISHGNWENRWKASITNNSIRWTIKTNSGITDLDSESKLKTDSLYNITLTYSGSDLEIYINGEFDTFKPWQGSISTTTYDLILGQCLPGNTQYGFKGVLDEIRIFDYALSSDRIKEIYSTLGGVKDDEDEIPSEFYIAQNYPNPFNGSTVIKFSIPAENRGKTNLSVYDILGNRVAVIFDKEYQPGNYEIRFNTGELNLASGVYIYKLTSGSFRMSRKMLLLK